MIGAGTMRTGIAVGLADTGLTVTVVETSARAMEAGHGRVRATYDRMLKSNRISAVEHAARLSRITFSEDFGVLARPDLVIEAVYEDIAVKQDVFRRLGATAKPGAVLATNTSYLDIAPIAAASGRGADVIGLHFFAPANIMRLVEIVKSAGSDKRALATGLALAKRLGLRLLGDDCEALEAKSGPKSALANTASEDEATDNGVAQLCISQPRLIELSLKRRSDW